MKLFISFLFLDFVFSSSAFRKIAKIRGLSNTAHTLRPSHTTMPIDLPLGFISNHFGIAAAVVSFSDAFRRLGASTPAKGDMTEFSSKNATIDLLTQKGILAFVYDSAVNVRVELAKIFKLNFLLVAIRI